MISFMFYIYIGNLQSGVSHTLFVVVLHFCLASFYFLLLVCFVIQYDTCFHFVVQNDRATHKRFLRPFFTNFVKDLGGTHRNTIKCLVKEIDLVIMLVYSEKLAGGVRAEKLEGLSLFSCLVQMKLLKLLRYILLAHMPPYVLFEVIVIGINMLTA